MSDSNESEETMSDEPLRVKKPESAPSIICRLQKRIEDLESTNKYYESLGVPEMDRELKTLDDIKFKLVGAEKAREIGLERLEAMEADRDEWKAKYETLLKETEDE
jgi:hypothetical protein